MLRQNWIIGAMLMGLLVISAAGCGGGTGEGGTFGSAETLTFEGWDDYRKGSDNEKAQDLFNNALNLDPTHSEALNGLGWLDFRGAAQADGQEQTQLLEAAKTNFQKATASDPDNVDAWVGLAGVELAKGNWPQAASSALAALNLDSRYFSAHDNIDYRDVHLILAESYFFLGWFKHTQETPDPNNTVHHLDVLSPGFKRLYQNNELTPPDLILKIEELQRL
jgi:tetratricopeptide (TPR) repeat protein